LRGLLNGVHWRDPVFHVHGGQCVVFNDRMPLIHSLRHNRAAPHRRSEFMPVNRRSAATWHLLTRANIAERHLSLRRMRRFGHPADINSLIDDYVVLHGVVVDDRRPVVNFCHLGWREPPMPQVMVMKIPQRNKGKQIHAEAEIESAPTRTPLNRNPPPTSKSACSGSGAQPQWSPELRHDTRPVPKPGPETRPIRNVRPFATVHNETAPIPRNSRIARTSPRLNKPSGLRRNTAAIRG